jgi:hypothetical protein
MLFSYNCVVFNLSHIVSLGHRLFVTCSKIFYRCPHIFHIYLEILSNICKLSAQEDNIKMDLIEIGVNVVDWIGLAQDR